MSLTQGESVSPSRYLGFLLVTPRDRCLDNTLFSGYFTLAFAALALVVAPCRRVFHLVVVISIVFLFSVGPLSFVATAAYHLVPGMKLFRHIHMTSSWHPRPERQRTLEFQLRPRSRE